MCGLVYQLRKSLRQDRMVTVSSLNLVNQIVDLLEKLVLGSGI